MPETTSFIEGSTKAPPKKDPNDSPTENFGFEQVTPSEKTAKVKDVFHRVSSRYDVMNDVMSLGIHRLWKNMFVGHLPLSPHQKIVDVAGGTGDITQRIFAKQPDCEVTICDINEMMMGAGRNRFPHTQNLRWVCGDACALPLPSHSQDLYVISFGLRNVTYRQKALEEAYRVLKPGGSFYCLEFSHVTLPLLQELYRLYSFMIIPKLGRWVSGEESAYQYLVESIAGFPLAEDLTKEIESAGFTLCSYKKLSGGIAAIHKGRKA